MSQLGKGILSIVLWATLIGSHAQAEVKTFSDNSLLRLSKSVYFKSTLTEWRTLMQVAQACPASSEGPLLLNHVVDQEKVKRALAELSAPDLRLANLPKEAVWEELLFLWRLELYQSTRGLKREIKFKESCLKNLAAPPSASQRLSQLEMILRDRVGIEDAPKVKLPLRPRQLELIASLRDTIESQYALEWLLAP